MPGRHRVLRVVVEAPNVRVDSRYAYERHGYAYEGHALDYEALIDKPTEKRSTFLEEEGLELDDDYETRAEALEDNGLELDDDYETRADALEDDGLELDDEYDDDTSADALEDDGLELDDEYDHNTSVDALEDDGLELDDEYDHDTSADALEQESLALPESAFIDSPKTSTRDLLMSAIDVTARRSQVDRDTQQEPLSQLPAHQKPYVFLEDPSIRQERRSSARFPLAINGELIRTPGKKEPIRVTSGSAHAFFACTPNPLEPGTFVHVEMNMLGSYRLRIPARVVRTTDRGFAVQLDPDPKTVSYRAAFLELARQANLLSPSVRIEVSRPTEEAPSKEANELEHDSLEEAWAMVLEHADDDDVHQAFIHQCMRAQNIEFAVARYREQVERGQRFADKYLEQLGTILSFYNMVVRDELPDADEYTAGRVKAFLMIAFAIVISVSAARWLAHDPVNNVNEIRHNHQGGGIIHLNLDLPTDRP